MINENCRLKGNKAYVIRLDRSRVRVHLNVCKPVARYPLHQILGNIQLEQTRRSAYPFVSCARRKYDYEIRIFELHVAVQDPSKLDFEIPARKTSEKLSFLMKFKAYN